MIKRKLLGQHFLNSKFIAEFIVKEARISKTDIVFEIGTGIGILTSLLCENAQKVISLKFQSWFGGRYPPKVGRFVFRGSAQLKSLPQFFFISTE